MNKKTTNNRKFSFSSIDFFGLSYNFNIDGEETHKTNSGAFFTIFYFVIIIGLFFGFGVDLYQRKRPKVSNSNKIVDYQETMLSNNNFTFAFRVEDRTGAMIQNDSIVSLELTYFYYIMGKDGAWKSIFSDILPFKKCGEFNLTKEKEVFYNISLASWYCVDFDNFKIGGNWDGNFVYGLIVNTKQCQYSKNKTCLKEDDLKLSFQDELTGSNYFYSFLYMEALPEMDNFEKPINTHLINKYDLLNLKLTKRSIHFYKQVTAENDKGWFISDLENLNYYSSDSIISDFSLKEEFSQDVLYTHLIYLRNKIDIYNRSYTKIQEVIANIGGFTKIFFSILSYIYLYLGKVLKNTFLIKKIESGVYEDYEFKRNEEKINMSSSINKLNLKENFNNTFNKNHNNIFPHFRVDLPQNSPNILISKNNVLLKENVINPIKQFKINFFEKKNDPVIYLKKINYQNNNNISSRKILNQDEHKFNLLNLSFFRNFCKKRQALENLHYKLFYKFTAYFEGNTDIIHYMKMCIEFQNMKKILFEDKVKIFCKLKPDLDSSEHLENSEFSKKEIKKSDRIVKNLIEIAKKDNII